jgi:hypothetical protein
MPQAPQGSTEQMSLQPPLTPPPPSATPGPLIADDDPFDYAAMDEPKPSSRLYDGGLKRAATRSPGSPTAEDEPRPSRVGPIILVMALIAGAASAYFIATSVDVSTADDAPATNSQTANPEPPPAKLPDPAPTATAVSSDDASDAGATAAATAAPDASTGPGSVVLVFVTIDSDPPGASVYRGDEKVGATPYRVEVESHSGNTSYILRLDGYADATVVVPGDRSFADTIVLEKR